MRAMAFLQGKKRLYCIITAMLVCLASFSADAAIVLDRMYQTTNSYSTYMNPLRYKMNCYGFAIQVYSYSGGNDSSDAYLQQPGEFRNDSATFNALFSEYRQYFDPNYAYYLHPTVDQTFSFMEGKMFADFQTLYSSSGSEWTITASTLAATVPSGYRKIALALTPGFDYHFYMRNSDGTWSHKPGITGIQSTSETTHTAITDSNISTVGLEGGYSGGIRYYLIKKSAVIDYPHSYGHGTALYTAMMTSDKAGEVAKKACYMAGTSVSGRMDHDDDLDYFYFYAPSSGSFTLSCTSQTADMDLYFYNTDGAILSSDTAYGDATIVYSLSGGSRYFVCIRDGDGEMGSTYVFSYSKN